MYDAVVVGCGLSGAVVARHLAEKQNKKVLIIDRRSHIGGNMYDYKDSNGILVHKYGPHTFHTKKKELYDFMCRFGEWIPYKLTCGAVMQGKYTPTPFNYQTIDDYFDSDEADRIKKAIQENYPVQTFATVLEMLQHENTWIRKYAQFLFDHDYSLYTAKQWGISPSEIDPSVLKRVPIRFSYDIGYFDDEFQVMPKTSYVDFFEALLKHDNIHIQLNTSADSILSLDEDTHTIRMKATEFKGIVIYTGAIDELFQMRYGALPYRSLRFEWKTENKDSFQDAPVVAYPEAEGYTRITEYKKLPVQQIRGVTTYAVEYSIPYQPDVQAEPYYPIPTKESEELYQKYKELADQYPQLYLCGRLADYRYYNMDQALEKALMLLK